MSANQLQLTSDNKLKITAINKIANECSTGACAYCSSTPDTITVTFADVTIDHSCLFYGMIMDEIEIYCRVVGDLDGPYTLTRGEGDSCAWTADIPLTLEVFAGCDHVLCSGTPDFSVNIHLRVSRSSTSVSITATATGEGPWYCSGGLYFDPVDYNPIAFSASESMTSGDCSSESELANTGSYGLAVGTGGTGTIDWNPAP
jgi:hypothetical protein